MWQQKWESYPRCVGLRRDRGWGVRRGSRRVMGFGVAPGIVRVVGSFVRVSLPRSRMG